jgi:hypothetical protein
MVAAPYKNFPIYTDHTEELNNSVLLRQPKVGLTPRQQLATSYLQHFLVMLPVITKKCCKQHVSNCCLGVRPSLDSIVNLKRNKYNSHHRTFHLKMTMTVRKTDSSHSQ